MAKPIEFLSVNFYYSWRKRLVDMFLNVLANRKPLTTVY